MHKLGDDNYKNKFFSDKENGTQPQIHEKIPYSVFNGILAVCNEYAFAMSFKFPFRCPDNGMIVGFDEKAFKDLARALIPNFRFIDYNINDHVDSDQYALLDYIEFCMENIGDYEKKRLSQIF